MGGIPKKLADAQGVEDLWKSQSTAIRASYGWGVEKPKKEGAFCHGCQQPLTREHRAFRRMMFSLLAALVGFLTPSQASAESAPVIITEIAAFAESDHEWIEIVNRSDAPVNLEGWKFFEEGTNHKLALAQGADSILDPGEYAVIADVASNFILDYPTYDNTLFDSSWTTLAEDGESIALKDAEGTIVEEFTYLAATKGSLQRLDIFQNDYTASNWIERSGEPTPGDGYAEETNDGGTGNDGNHDAQSTLPLEHGDGDGSAPEDVEDHESSGDSGEPSEDEEPVTIPPGSVVINEFLADPSGGGHEWIELWNRTNFLLDLHSWKLEDGAGTMRTLNVLVGPGPHVVELATSKLNNGGDRIMLRDAIGTVIDEVVYGSWDDGSTADKPPAPDDGEAVGRFPDAEGNFAILAAPTPGAANSEPFVEPMKTPSSPSAEPTPPREPPSISVVLSELFPDPSGGDEDEWIELWNSGAASATLESWSITDGVTIFSLTGRSIPAGGFLLLPRNETNIALANHGRETVKLQTSAGKIVSKVTYPEAREGLSFSLDASGNWNWSISPTPGGVNVIHLPNSAPIAEAYAPRDGQIGELLLFDATDSVDPDSPHLDFTWDFGDGTIGTFPRMLHAFQSPGTHRVTLTATDREGGSATTKKTITITGTAQSVHVTTSDVADPPKPAPKTAPRKKPTTRKVVKTKASATGIATALPGVLNKRTFLINSDSGPTEIYLHTQDFPMLKVGDRITAAGRWSERDGLRRLIVSSPEQIVVSTGEELPETEPIRVMDISAEDEGRIVAIAGEIVEMSRLGLRIDDGTGELTISKPSSGWPTNIGLGAKGTFTGIARSAPQGFSILPRNADDIAHIQPPPRRHEENARPPPGSPSLSAGAPLALAALASSVGGTFYFRKRRTKKSRTHSLPSTL